MGYRCGFLILAEEENRTTRAIEEVFRQRAEEDKRCSDEYYAKDEAKQKEDGTWKDRTEKQNKAREYLKSIPAISEKKLDSGTEYLYYKSQGYYLTDYVADDWFRKPNGVLGAKKNQKYKVLFESCHNNTGFPDVKGKGGQGMWKYGKYHAGHRKKLSYYDLPLYYAIVDRLKRFKNVEAKLFAFEVNDGMRRTRPKFIEDWPGEIL